jgi:hypothetical protein
LTRKVAICPRVTTSRGAKLPSDRPDDACLREPVDAPVVHGRTVVGEVVRRVLRQGPPLLVMSRATNDAICSRVTCSSGS